MNSATRLISINVDPQNDFINGSLAVAGGSEVIEPLNKINKVVRDKGGQVIFTRDWHPAETNHFIPFGGPWPPHCVAGSTGAEFHEDVVIEPEDIIVSKGTAKDEDAFSGFQGVAEDGRSLTEIVTPRNNERIIMIIGGLATDYCDLATVLDAKKVPRQNQIEVYAVTDAMRAVNLQPGDGDAALDEMRQAGVMMTTAREIIERIAK